MNIFKVLSQGRGRLNEENLSAMLGFLLSPAQTHGLGDVFLRQFLNTISIQNSGYFEDLLSKQERIQAEVLLENPYRVDEKRRIVDIEIRILNRKPVLGESLLETHRIVIENKIHPSTSDEEQLTEEFIGVLDDIDDETAIIMVFLTPPGENSKLRRTYDKLDQQILGPHRKVWLRWNDDRFSIIELLKELLNNEAAAEVPPIGEYLRHTLKAFVRHILESPAGAISEKLTGRFDPGDLIDAADVTISLGKFKIERYQSTTIKAFNLGSGEYETTKPILRQIIKEKSLDINLYLNTGRPKSTRSLGRAVIQQLRERGDLNYNEK